MVVWAVANQKGGVGKTTTAVSLAGLLTMRGYNTLLVDVDPHGSMTSYFGHDPDTIEDSVYSLFQEHGTDDVDKFIRTTRFDHLYLLPSSTALTTLDRQLGTQSGKGLVLSRAFAQVSDQFDYVIIDCPPMLGVLMVNALAACDQLLVPVQTEFLALKGLERMMRTISMINHSRKPPLTYRVIPTMFDRRTRASMETLDVIKQRYDADMWHDVIPVDTKFREASKAGIPLPLMGARTRGAIAYASLLNELIGPADIADETMVASQ